MSENIMEDTGIDGEVLDSLRFRLPVTTHQQGNRPMMVAITKSQSSREPP
jgi:hypothetical protein